MVKKLCSRDVKYTKVAYSPWAKDLLAGKAGKAANLPIEKKRLYDYFKKSLKESKGNTTVAIARTMGYLKKDSEFSSQEIMGVKSGLREKGYYVPGYSISAREKAVKDAGVKNPQDDRGRRLEEIAARGGEVKKEVGKELGRYFSSSKAPKKSAAASFFSSRPRF
jgi:hypothetical protein